MNWIPIGLNWTILFKCLEMTIVVIWRYINKTELNWIELIKNAHSKPYSYGRFCPWVFFGCMVVHNDMLIWGPYALSLRTYCPIRWFTSYLFDSIIFRRLPSCASSFFSGTVDLKNGICVNNSIEADIKPAVFLMRPVLCTVHPVVPSKHVLAKGSDICPYQVAVLPATLLF